MEALILVPAASASTSYPPIFVPTIRQPQATPDDGPAIAIYGSQQFYVAWTGYQSPKVFYSGYGSNCKHFSLLPCWTPQTSVSGPWGKALVAYTAPALADYNGDMYAFWPGLATKKVFYSAYNGTDWSDETTLGGSWGTALTDDTVALVVYNGDLYAAWVPCCASNNINYSYFNGSSWSPSQGLPFLPSRREVSQPALAVYQGDLYLFWTAQGGATHYSTYNGSAWSSPSSVAGTWGKVVAGAAMSVAVCDGDLFAAWVFGLSTAVQDIRYSDFDGSTWTKPVVVPGTKAVLGVPALVASGDNLYMAWGKYVFNNLGNLVRTRVLVTYAENVGTEPPPLQ